MAKFDFEKYVKDGHLQGDFDRAVAKAAAEAKALGLPPAGLDKLGKRMLPRERAAPADKRTDRSLSH
jgi:hypothetical protein